MAHALILCTASFWIGAFPFIAIIFFLATRRSLSKLGTGNVSVSAAFYHGGTIIGVLAVVSEAIKGIGVVELARYLIPDTPQFQLLALCCLVLGRFLIGKGAGTTNAVWGMTAYHWRVAFFLLLLSGGFFLFDRDRNRSKYLVLFLLPLMVAVMVQDVTQTLLAMGLAGLLAMIYLKIGDDLSLDGRTGKNSAMFHFLQGTPPQKSLDQSLDSQKVGAKASNLSFLKQQGYNVPAGWVLQAGDDPEHFVSKFKPSPDDPLVVRSSATGEDTLDSSAAGQYETVLNITSQVALLAAIARCQDSFEHPSAVYYRQTHNIHHASMAVLVQPQIKSQYSGVAFSRDPLESWIDQVLIEGVVGHGSQLVSGQTTPERCTVSFASKKKGDRPTEHDVRGQYGEIPLALILDLAKLTRQLEETFQGVPQDIEWTYDGQKIWILQSRPITTLVPTWTRKIAAEVIPGLIHPLTWSINQPLTCGVWGKLFEQVLGTKSSADLNFRDTATLHFGRAYFNASLLGQIFLRMGLPPESLEFLTHDASITPPKGLAVFKSLPGLTRLITQEIRLDRQFAKQKKRLNQLLIDLSQTNFAEATDIQLLAQIQQILSALEQATYFQIMAPLSFAIRQKIWRHKDKDLDTSSLPEISAVKAITTLASHIPSSVEDSPEAVLQYLENGLSNEWQAFMDQFGYLSEVATDISVPTWAERPEIIAQSIQLQRKHASKSPQSSQTPSSQKTPKRLKLKGEVAQIYNQLLAYLRHSFVALEEKWIQQRDLEQTGDIFFLAWDDIQAAIEKPNQHRKTLLSIVQEQRKLFLSHEQVEEVPALIYGQTPERMPSSIPDKMFTSTHHSVMEGVGASAGQVEGAITLVNSLREIPAQITPEMILVVPFTDAGWAPIFANAGGIISEVGGKLSHGAILAREYGIPAVMDVKSARKRLQNGQKVRIDGLSGRVEILS